MLDKYNKFLTKAIKIENGLDIELQLAYNFECNFTNKTTSNYEIWHNGLRHLNSKYM